MTNAETFSPGTANSAGDAVTWSLFDRIYHYGAAAAYALRPKRVGGLLDVMRVIVAHAVMPAQLRPAVPDPRRALAAPDGFAGVCPDLEINTLLAGYRTGVYQTSHAGPYKWWSPAERMVLFPDELHLEKNLKRKLRQGRFRVTFDQDFAAVVHHCAGPRQQRRVQLTWLLPEVIDAFVRLHEAGHAHSVEIRDEAGALVGGLFGVSAGRLFFTESQFALERDASKIAFAILNRHLQAWGYALNDVRKRSDHLERLGCSPIPRDDYLAIVNQFVAEDLLQVEWRPVEALCSGDWEPAAQPGWTREQLCRAVSTGSRPGGQGEADFAADPDVAIDAAENTGNASDGDTMPSAA